MVPHHNKVEEDEGRVGEREGQHLQLKSRVPKDVQFNNIYYIW